MFSAKYLSWAVGHVIVVHVDALTFFQGAELAAAPWGGLLQGFRHR